MIEIFLTIGIVAALAIGTTLMLIAMGKLHV
jgi:hypothetical protein